MSMIPDNMRVEYKAVRVKIIGCTSPAPQCWYRPLIGKVLNVDRKTWYEDGKISSVSYEMKRTPDGGFNGHIMRDDVEEI